MIPGQPIQANDHSKHKSSGKVFNNLLHTPHRLHCDECKMQIYVNFLIKFERNSLVISWIVKSLPCNFTMTFNCPNILSLSQLTFSFYVTVLFHPAKSQHFQRMLTDMRECCEKSFSAAVAKHINISNVKLFSFF